MSTDLTKFFFIQKYFFLSSIVTFVTFYFKYSLKILMGPQWGENFDTQENVLADKNGLKIFFTQIC